MSHTDDEIDYARLGEAAMASRLVLKRFREERVAAVTSYAGNHYSDNGSPETLLPVNLLAKYIDIVGRTLVPKMPRFMLSTTNDDAKPAVSQMQSWMNDKLKRIGFQENLHRTAVDGLFSIGIMKVGIAGPSDASIRGWSLKGGEIYCEPVDLNDFVYDIHATRFDEADYIGHRCFWPLSSLKGTKLYDRKKVKNLAPSPDPMYNRQGDQTIDVIGKGSIGKGSTRLRDYVAVWEFYIPWAKRICVIADDDLGTECEPLREFEYIGPDCGPYHFLRFNIVPGNAMPKGPAMDLIDLNESYNEIEAKLIRQALRQKENIPVASANVADVQRYLDAADGEAFQCDTPAAALKAVATTGANQNNNAYAMKLDERFNSLAGNIALIGGTAAQSPTASQDKMLNENSSRQVSDMQATMLEFTAQVGSAMAWYWWNHPEVIMETTWSPKAYPDMSIKRKLTPIQRQEIPWEEIDLNVDPYSMIHSTPAQQAQKLTAVFTQLIAPAMGLFREQGASVDVNFLLEKLGEYENIHDLRRLMMQVTPPGVEDSPESTASGGAGQDGAGMPANTTRTYERVSRSQQTPGGQAEMAMNMARGQNPGGNPATSAEA